MKCPVPGETVFCTPPHDGEPFRLELLTLARSRLLFLGVLRWSKALNGAGSLSRADACTERSVATGRQNVWGDCTCSEFPFRVRHF